MFQQSFCSFLFLLCAVTVASFVPNNCNQGSKYWCKNEDTASECGVLQFCKLKHGSNLKEKKIRFHSDSDNVAAAPPVKVELYYESLCPGCRAFIMGQLFPTFQKLSKLEMLDIGLYPYGNAREYQDGQKWKFECQHGVEECQVNTIEACALHLLSHPNQFMPFIHCVESNPSMAQAKYCASLLKVQWEPLYACYNGSEGNQLQHQLALKTDALNPPHQYVPWIVVNSVHTDAIQNRAQSNLMNLVCETYTGVKPHICRVAEKDKYGRCHKV